MSNIKGKSFPTPEDIPAFPKLPKAMTGQSWGPGWNHNYGQSAKL